jgi:hypothetical protein
VWRITVQAIAEAAHLPAAQAEQERDPCLDTLPAAQGKQAARFKPPVVSFSLRCLDAFSHEQQAVWASMHIPEVSKNFPAPQATHVELNV